MTGYESKRAAAHDKLAQPAQEPVAWMYPDALCDRACLYVCTKAFTQFPECATTPPQPAQEPAIGDIRALKHRIHELEGEVIGYKRILNAQPAQAPVAWRKREAGGGWQYEGWEETGMTYEALNRFNKNGFECEAIPAIQPQPVQEPEQEPMRFAGIQMWVGDKRMQILLAQKTLHYARDPWALMEYNASMCISKLKEINNGN